MSKNLHLKIFKWFWAVLPGQKQICVFLWLPNRKCYGKNYLFWPGRMLKMAWFSMHAGFWTCQFQWHRFCRLYIQMFLSYGLYRCIILETAHHRATFGIFCNITQNAMPEEIAGKCSIFLHQLYFFLLGRSRTFWGDKDQISYEEGKRKG